MGRLQDYTIDHQGLDWAALLATWAWLLPRTVTVWLMNRFGDLFLVLADGSVHMLDTGRGSLERVADDREDFARRIDQDGNANDWLMIPLIDKLVTAGFCLRPGECYSYWRLPVLGGEYAPANTKIVTIDHHFKAFGPIHDALRDVPDGTSVQLEVKRDG
jgi:hypothetical protein